MEPFVSIDMRFGVINRYEGRSPYTLKPRKTHKRELADEDWARVKSGEVALAAESIEAYRQNPPKDDAIPTWVPPPTPDSPPTRPMSARIQMYDADDLVAVAA